MITTQRRTLSIRAAWLAATTLVLAIFLAGTPAALAIARTLSPETEASLRALGVPAGLPAAYLIAIDTLAMLFFATVAVLLVWQRPNERMARLSALMLLLTAALYTAPIYEAPVPLWLKAALSAGAELSQVAFVFAFPSGRFVPRRLPWALIPLGIWRFVIWNWVYLPNLFALDRSGERYPFLPQHPLDLLAFFAVLLVGVGVQVYRYRRLATRTEQQQVKWLLVGTVGAVLIVGSYTLLINLAGARFPAQSELLVRLAARTLRHLALALVPVALLYSVLRYRLWTIDTLINRTLAYGTVTGILAGLFGGLVVLLQMVFVPRTDTAYTALVAISTLLTVALARPLHVRIQQAINRRFDRRTWESEHLVKTLRGRLRDQVAVEQLAGHVLAVADQTWRPESVSLWVPAHEGRRANVRYEIHEA